MTVVKRFKEKEKLKNNRAVHMTQNTLKKKHYQMLNI